MRRWPQPMWTMLLGGTCAILVVLCGVARAQSIQTFGEGADAVFVVDHGDTLSIWADAVSAEVVLEHLREVGGPTVSSVTPLTRPVTLTVHEARWEDILRKMLDGHSYSVTYKSGRVAHVHVMQMISGRTYKTPSPTESRSKWTRIELGRDSG